MGVQPQDSRDPASPSPASPPPATARPCLARRLAPLALAAGVAAVAWWGADGAAAGLYRQLKPQLERQLGRVMGHPLELGPYRGLRPWGVAAGASRFRPGPDNPSTAEVEAVTVSLDPLASLARQAWMLRLELRGARAELRPNRRGAYWELGRFPPGAEPPRLGLEIRLREAAQVRLLPPALAGQPNRPLQASLQGRTRLELWRRQLRLDGSLRPAAGGVLPFQGALNWRDRRWSAAVAPRQLPVAPLVPLLPAGVQRQLAGRLEGLASGRLELMDPGRSRSAQASWRPTSAGTPDRRCQGQLQVRGARWRWPVLPAPLAAERLTLRCRGQALQLLPGELAMGPWSGRVQGRFQLAGRQAGRLELQLQARERQRGHRLGGSLAGPWRHLAGRLQGRLQLPAIGQGPARPLDLSARLELDGRPDRRGAAPLRLLLPELVVRRGDARLTAGGSVWPRLDLRSRELRLGRDLWRDLPALTGPLGASPQLEADLRASGSLADPRLALALRQRRNLLVGPWNAQLAWARQRLVLEQLTGPELRASGRMPLAWGRQGLRAGELNLQLALRRYPLARLTPLLGSRVRGVFEAWGTLRGPLAALRPELELQVESPGAGPLALAETWRGHLIPTPGGGGALELDALAPAPPGRLTASLGRNWLPSRVQLERQEGQLAFSGSPRRYLWRARAFPLAGLSLALGPRQRLQPLSGLLSGQGALDLQPLWMHGSARIEAPQLLGIRGRRFDAHGEYRGDRFELTGLLQPRGDGRRSGGQIGLRLRGERGGALWSRLEGRDLSADLIRELLEAWPQWRGGPPPPRGRARDLGSLAIDTLGGSLQDQLQALAAAQQQLASRVVLARERSPRPQLHDLQALVDANLTLTGPSPDRLHLDLSARGHLWLEREDRDQVLASEPLRVRLEGPLGQGGGRFSFDHLPLALLAMLTPVPEGLRGGLSAQGRYRLGGASPELEATLALQQASLNGQALSLERGALALDGEALEVDWSLRSAGASSDVEFKGRVPLQPEAEGLELRLASRADGLRFLASLAGPSVRWQQGTADLQLLVRGSLRQPIANGFLRFRKGVLEVAGQTMRELEATVLFDFAELELQELSARVGERGLLSGSGQLALVTPSEDQARPLTLQLRQAPFSVPRLRAVADGAVRVGGSLLRPQLGGELRLSRGVLNVQPGQLAKEEAPEQPVSMRQLVEERWDFNQPIVVMGPDIESGTSRSLREAVPNLPFIGLDGLRLRLGPDLRVVVPNVVNFSTAGLLTLNGPLDPSLQARGVVRLLNGRLGLFTTSFSLDPDAPNVAVFTPSLGLIPYLDIALRTRVSDNIATGRTDRSSIYDWNVAAPTTALDQLNLIRVVLTVSGPADRLMENIRLRSSPPLPEDRLVALIGGNSLVGLIGGNATAALATALGQSLLSPVVGSLSEAFGQRFSFALYPTYFAPADTASSSGPGQTRTRRIPSQLVLGSEIGLDLTERFNFSVLAAPNRSDIPPQMTLRYQASDKLGLQGSVDSEGRWQTQLQLFFRF